ncbi:MAG: threonine-phosphate decarboxylase [Rhodospirillales bacterium]|nr:threonine-phosphate decarboxylase [Rhodospirillales bacterium]MBO6785967.1 threonine-phosphate decarboxylase [Rhodospirillales bacterium]
MTGKLRHGGDVDAATAAFGTPPGGWIDLSTGINPVPYPIPTIDTDIWQRLPTASDETALLEAARGYYRVPDQAGIIAAPGTQAIIQWLPLSRPPCRVQVIGPTYEEHAASWRTHGHEVRVTDSLADADADVIIVVNPNNPDGHIFAADELVPLAARLAAQQGMLIVDEAFADVAPETSIISEAGRPGLLILRSFGKFFGLAGLRLGFAVGTTTDTERLRRAMGPWSVAGPALDIGAAALSDSAWQAETRRRLGADTARLDSILTDAGLEIVGGTTLYRLAKSGEAARIYERLGRAGIMVRKFDYNPTWLRFGLPGCEDDWQRLAAALS